MESEGAISPKILARAPPLVHPPLTLLFVGGEFDRGKIPELAMGKWFEDVDRPLVAPGAPVIQFLDDKDSGFPIGGAFVLLNHKPLSRLAPFFQSDSGESIGVKEDREFVLGLLVQIVEEFELTDHVVAEMPLGVFAQVGVLRAVPGLNGVEPLFKEVLVSFNLPVSQQMLVRCWEGGDVLRAIGTTKFYVDIIVLKRID